MKNVLADGRLTQRGEGGQANIALVHPPTTPIPHRGVHMWSVGAARLEQQPEQTR